MQRFQLNRVKIRYVFCVFSRNHYPFFAYCTVYVTRILPGWRSNISRQQHLNCLIFSNIILTPEPAAHAFKIMLQLPNVIRVLEYNKMERVRHIDRRSRSTVSVCQCYHSSSSLFQICNMHLLLCFIFCLLWIKRFEC